MVDGEEEEVGKVLGNGGWQVAAAFYGTHTVGTRFLRAPDASPSHTGRRQPPAGSPNYLGLHRGGQGGGTPQTGEIGLTAVPILAHHP